MRQQYDTLLHLSGGMDSAFCLWQALTERPDERVYVHHVLLRHNAEDRMSQEQQACLNIIRWLRANDLDNFDYHESRFDYGNLPRISIKDIQIVAMFSGIILRTPNYSGWKRMLLCWHHGEVDDLEISRGYRVRAMLTALEAPEIAFEFPIRNMTRLDMARQMPAELLAMVWYCRKPVVKNGESQSCGKCKTCLEMNVLKQKALI